MCLQNIAVMYITDLLIVKMDIYEPHGVSVKFWSVKYMYNLVRFLHRCKWDAKRCSNAFLFVVAVTWKRLSEKKKIREGPRGGGVNTLTEKFRQA